MRPTPQDNQLMSKHRVLSLKPQLRLEWRGQDGQNETEQRNHSASLGDSIPASTQIGFSVRTIGKSLFGPYNFVDVRFANTGPFATAGGSWSVLRDLTVDHKWDQVQVMTRHGATLERRLCLHLHTHIHSKLIVLIAPIAAGQWNGLPWRAGDTDTDQVAVADDSVGGVEFHPA